MKIRYLFIKIFLTKYEKFLIKDALRISANEKYRSMGETLRDDAIFCDKISKSIGVSNYEF